MVRVQTGDRILLATVVGLVLFGVVMVYSSSAIMAQQLYGDQFHFLIKQAMAALLGIAAMIALMNFDYLNLKRPAVVYGLLGLSIFLLVLVLFLPVTKGTHRFIRLVGFSFQPSELAKIALIVFLAYYLEKRVEEIKSIKRTFVPCAVAAAIMMGLILLGKDLGTTFVLALVVGIMLIVAGVPLRYLLACTLPALPLLYWQLFHVPYRLERLKAFLDPWRYARDEGFQVVQSLIAVGSGGIHGLGLAQGRQKFFYLPEAHTDFIYAVVGEELGLVGAATVVLFFVIFLWRGLRAARSAPDSFGNLLAIGLTTMLATQALFNISVVLSLVPAKGIPLPFISYGGSSLLISLLSVGVLLNLSQHVE
ncbi:MAG: putative lipid II flippase FtsW [Acidobacteriota bacterium]